MSMSDAPWKDEPDRVEWYSRELPCLMRRGVGGSWCGYVAVPPGHPWHGDAEPDVSAHGGVTYTGACHGDVCHVPRPGEPDDVWWIGFDCAHAGDLVPAFAGTFTSQYGMYRDLEYVRAEVERLAEQAAAAR